MNRTAIDLAPRTGHIFPTTVTNMCIGGTLGVDAIPILPTGNHEVHDITNNRRQYICFDSASP
jgi:hypothetical protein